MNARPLARGLLAGVCTLQPFASDSLSEHRAFAAGRWGELWAKGMSQRRYAEELARGVRLLHFVQLIFMPRSGAKLSDRLLPVSVSSPSDSQRPPSLHSGIPVGRMASD